ncbi:fatty-acyl-CoA synthase [Microbacterium resistens]|uniref:Fatty-acyl-CoA synthase n=1 Tax=Microbacterium resistens TaxID=156977 RepID=A0ABU1SFI8_9MICO|nr:long-chain-fatty-acid--CoA ligase [Microbacterium resistens]MDR6868359.1 fatty-acyl-CoA synthase [Microbacterium resistens]
MMSLPEQLAQLEASRRGHWMAQLDRHAQARPDQAALRFAGETTTWAQLRDRVGRLAGVLARRGVARGDRVAIATGNRPEFLEALIAAGWIGAIAVPINFRLAAPEITYALDDSGARVLIADETTGDAARAAAAGALTPPVLIDISAEGGRRYEALLEEGPPAPFIDVREDDAALIMYTSGTTGRPKGAVLTHRNLIAQSLTIIRAFHLTGDGEASLVASPLFHIGALGSVAPCLHIGATIVIAPTGAFSAEATLDLLESEQASTCFLVPTQWQALCDSPTVAGRDLAALRVLGWGAAPASESLLHRMAEVFPQARAVALFGQTEMSPVTCVLEAKDAVRKLGSVGRPIPSVSVRVLDADGNDVPRGEVGEIVYRGVGLMQGYWEKPEATAEAFEGGWFHSGDLVRRDEDGFVYVVDRAKDMIISGGENIYSTEVENALAAHPQIADVAVVGMPHTTWGETPVAVVVLADPAAPLDIEAVRAHGATLLARYKLPTAVRTVKSLPRNPAGKVLKSALREMLNDD